MLVKKYLIICILLAGVIEIKSQVQDSADLNTEKLSWFMSFNYGAQMSGIKDEDFVGSNYAPLFNIAAGKWFIPYLALQIGYKGFYFYYIEDDLKHHFDYIYGEVVVNLNNAVQPKSSNKAWSLLLHSGAGYFYNHIYRKPNFCMNIGLQNTFQFTKQFQASVDISSIMGWNIYQGNEDILPGITLGVTYFFITE